MIDRLFSHNLVLRQQLDAPLLQEREQYLMYLLHRGNSSHRVRQVAATLLHVVRLMNLSSLRLIDPAEIDVAVDLWLADLTSPCRRPGREFRRVAIHWFRFHNSLAPKVRVPLPYGEILSQYLTYVSFTLSTSTAKVYFRWAGLFLSMTVDVQPKLFQLSKIDIDRFIDSKRSTGYKPSSLASVCVALRYFLRFTEDRGLTAANLSMTVKSPRIRRYEPQARGPHWKDVRRLLNSCGRNRADIRARAIISLCSIYALRASEVATLHMKDFNWIDETFTVRRAKSRIVQRYPLQFEVGEAILEYLQNCRPRCASSLLFVTLSPPYRQVSGDSIGGIVKERMKRLNIHASPMGPHSLRRSCATELLRKGISLADIADFLGHQGLSSVSVYAKCSPRAFKDVISVNLLDLL